MSAATDASQALRAAFVDHRAALSDVLRRYGARDARLFGSVARGDATSTSDCDVLVELDAEGGNELLRIAGIGEEFSHVLGIRVDVVTPGLLRTGSSANRGLTERARRPDRAVSRTPDERFRDILTAVQRCPDYRRYLDSSDGSIAGMAYDAILRNLAVIGAAVRALPDETTWSVPDIPWASIAGSAMS